MEQILLIDGNRGIYVPQAYAQEYPDTLDACDRDILLSGPEHEYYWDTWDNVINSDNPVTIDGMTGTLQEYEGNVFLNADIY